MKTNQNEIKEISNEKLDEKIDNIDDSELNNTHKYRIYERLIEE